MITEPMCKSALITLTVGMAKELIYDRLFGRGESLWEDMKWITLGTVQGVVFIDSMEF